jgi:hypothetical protein
MSTKNFLASPYHEFGTATTAPIELANQLA